MQRFKCQKKIDKADKIHQECKASCLMPKATHEVYTLVRQRHLHVKYIRERKECQTDKSIGKDYLLPGKSPNHRLISGEVER